MVEVEDKILHCLLRHKAVLTEEDKKMLFELENNNIKSDRYETDYCLDKKYLTHSILSFENGQYGLNTISQISLSSLGETEIKRLWANSSLNSRAKRKMAKSKFVGKLWLSVLSALIAAIVLFLLKQLYIWLSQL